MPRRRFRFDEEKQEMVEVSPDYETVETRAFYPTEELTYGNARATDGTPINSRKKHRDYLKATNSSMFSDWTETNKKAAYVREHGDPADRKVMREQIGRIIHEVESKNRRKR